MAKIRRNSTIYSDVLVIGGGHSGLSLAASLGALGIHVVCLERAVRQPQKSTLKDGRTLALSFRSMEIFKKAGVAPFLMKNCCPILDIRVADQGSSHYLDFHHQDVGNNPFGWIIENNLFNQALEKRIAQIKTVQLIHSAAVKAMERTSEGVFLTLEDGRHFSASLVVGADGRKSQCREMAGIPTYGWNYRQTAIVCTIKHSKPHKNVAVEHFQPGGPFATLPMTESRSSIVWTEKTATAKTLLAMDEDKFTELLQEKVEGYLGKIKLLGERFSFPLQLQHAEYYTSKRLALIGDAAHGIHPIAGQGFNLGMGDIEALTEEVSRAANLGLDIGSADLLNRYEKRRKFDNGNMVLMTDLLDRLFSNSIPAVQATRRFGLGAVQRIAPLRRYFMTTAMGGRTHF